MPQTNTHRRYTPQSLRSWIIRNRLAILAELRYSVQVDDNPHGLRTALKVRADRLSRRKALRLDGREESPGKLFIRQMLTDQSDR